MPWGEGSGVGSVGMRSTSFQPYNQVQTAIIHCMRNVKIGEPSHNFAPRMWKRCTVWASMAACPRKRQQYDDLLLLQRTKCYLRKLHSAQPERGKSECSSIDLNVREYNIHYSIS